MFDFIAHWFAGARSSGRILLIHFCVWVTSSILLLAVLGIEASADDLLAENQGGVDWSLWPDFDDPDTIWAPQLFIIAQPGTDRSLGAFEMTLPFIQHPDAIVFADARFRIDDEGSLEGNIGLAYRHALNDDWIIGGYGFFDALYSSNDNAFLQSTVGIEVFTEDWRARGNGYIPFGTTTYELSSLSGGTVEVSGNNIFVTGVRTEEAALPGFDLEIGRRLNFIDLFDQLWVYGGLFYFDKSGFETIAGPRFRTEWFLDTESIVPGSRLEIGGEFLYDDVRKGQAFLTLAFRIPLGGTAAVRRAAEIDLGWRYWAMQTRILRDVDVVTSTSTNDVQQDAINLENGEVYTGIYFAEEGGTGGGTEGDPTDLDTAIDLAGENGIVVVNGDGGVIDSNGVTLLNGMSLVGGGATFSVGTEVGLTVGDDDQTLLSLVLPGSRPTINGTGDDLITIADGASGVFIQNLDLTGSNLSAIIGSNNSNLLISDVDIETPGGTGVSLTDAVDLTIDRINIQEASGISLVIDGLGGESVVSNITIVEALDDGIVLTNLSGEVTLGNFSIQTDSGHGLRLADSGGIEILGTNTINAQNGSALVIRNTDLEATFSSLTSDGSAGAGVLLDGVSGSINVTGTTTVQDAQGEGVAITNIAENGTEIDFGTVIVDNVNNEGLLIEGITGDRIEVTVGNVTIDDSDRQGVRIGSVSGDNGFIRLGQINTNDTELAGVQISDADGEVSIARANVTGTDNDSGIVVADVSDADITFGAISIDDVDGDGLRLTNIDGKIAFSNVTVNNTDGSGVVIDNIAANDAEIIIDDITATDIGETGVAVTNISGQDTEIGLGDLDIRNASRGLLVSAITGEDASITVSDVDVEDADEEAVFVNTISGNESSIEIGDIDADGVRQALVVSNISADDFEINVDSVVANNTDDDAVVLSGISGGDAEIELGDLDLSDVNRGLVINTISAAGASIRTGNVDVDTASGDAITITGLSGTGTAVEMQDLTLRDTQRGLVIDGITSSQARVVTGDIDATDIAGDAVLITNMTGNEGSVELGELDLLRVQQGLVIKDVTGTGTDIDIDSIAVNDATDDAIVLTGDTAIDGTITLGNIEVEDAQRGLAMVDLTLADGLEVVIGDVDVTDADDQGIALVNLDGGNASIEIGDVLATRPDAQGIIINAIAASDFELNIGNIDIEEPGAQGVLIDDVSGNDIGMFFGDTVIVEPVGNGVEETNITGSNVTIDFESITVID